MYHNKSQLNPVKHSRSRLSTTEAAPRNPPWPSWALAAWLPDGYSQIFRSYVIGPSGFWTMATLQNLIPSFPWIVQPRPPRWRNPKKERDQILPSGNLAEDQVRSKRADIYGKGRGALLLRHETIGRGDR